ncbi:hypothetical protein CERSUDRAFT_120047 [Gelatoporia subvermispora B]|uniref:Fe2OG dioxygenase domain-containing protein n=1 Tax=Ceriporiopsis subvermispora (strain B) TaxID=914234 RepID=M2QZ28_CERS8|nr:hypothetical protein CERSUDRAFT_120047 [Gelatoporia subvermispora B]
MNVAAPTRSDRRKANEECNFLGPGDPMGEGDTSLVLDFLPPDLASVAFEALLREVQWSTMHHRGGEVPRRVAVEGEMNTDGSFPIYRHPADESPPLHPFSPTVARIREHVERVLQQPVNHVLIQHYRTGADYISEHSDKTIDVVRGSKIVNVSLGAQRVMTLRTKKDATAPHSSGPDELADDVSSGSTPGARRGIQRIPLLHNSMFVMGLKTNARWMHGIRHDKRPMTLKTDAERAADGARISLTFRHIGTFLTRDQTRIYGQGGRSKTPNDARPVVLGGPEAEKLIIAFGNENHQSEFDWDANYGEGYDVLHFNVRAE